MKRFLLGLLAALLMSAGLAAVTSSPATAACPYTNCVQTATNSEAVSRATTRQRVRVAVGVKAAGNVAPRGTVTIRVSKGGRSVFTKTNAVAPRSANTSRTSFQLPRLRVGRYAIALRFKPASGSTFKASSGKTRTLTVRKPRRP